MDIPLIYVLIAAEILLVLLGLSITFAVLLMRSSTTTNTQALSPDDTETELDTNNPGTSYVDYLEQAMKRNTSKVAQHINIEKGEATEAATKENPEDNENNTAPAPDEKQSALLQAREQFLLLEKSAAENTEHEIKFWENLYAGLQEIVDGLKSTEVVNKTASAEADEDIQTESKEKVFYIETQGKKIDGEVNKLKDIISEQENALSSMQRAISDAEGELEDDSPSLAALKEQISVIERQLSDSKMCMDVLEMENTRLQQEVDKMENRHDALFSESEEGEHLQAPSTENSGEDVGAIKSQLSALEEELIKKDVAYAKLQDEFGSMETEYLAMYEAMHGDNT